MAILSTFARQVVTLWHSSDLVLIGQRRERRMRLLASLVLLLVGGFWCIFFTLKGAWGIVLMDLVLILSGLGVFILTLRHQARFANLLLFGVIISVIVGMTLLLDPPSAAAPRATHLYLLPFAVMALMAFRDEPVWLRYGVSVLCLGLFTVLASSSWAPASAYSLPDDVRVIGSWLQSIAAMLMLFVLLHILPSDAAERSILDRDLHLALREQQFVLHYQPQLNQAGKVIGAEVLIRWQHPQRGLVAPAEFIAHAEQAGMIIPMGQWVLEQAVKQLRCWRDDPLYAGINLAVNISQKQFRQPGFVAEVLTLLDAHAIDARLLDLELTETLVVQDIDDLLRKMAALAERGVRFSLDDFGTGFSSLSYLKRLPLDTLKIDRSFICDVLTDSSSATIVRSVIGLGQSMGMTVIAEGVETAAQQQFLLSCGCTQFQGYLFSKPLPLEAFAALVAQENG